MQGPLHPTLRAALEQTPGIIFDIQRFSLHDGPGLRTNVFFKGCSLRCDWCCNPESQRPTPEVAVFPANCFGCGDCLEVCPQEALRLEEGRIVRDEWRCDHCGQCVPVCAAGALRLIGRVVTAGEVLQEVLRDAVFYGQAVGGLTLTGGEPTSQPEFALALLRLAKAESLHTTLETCGQASWEVLETLLPYLDLVLYDIKHMDTQRHLQATGVGNEIILENVRRLVEAGAQVILRVPLIPGFNTNAEHLHALAEFASRLGITEVHLLPYHTLGRAKYQALGRSYLMEEIPPMKEGEAEAMADVVRSHGLHVKVGG
ncbi:MAG: glycyl-radical enzyme activating protein [Anaerolineae bacterium]